MNIFQLFHKVFLDLQSSSIEWQNIGCQRKTTLGHWTVQEAAQDFLIPRCIPRILLASELLCIVYAYCVLHVTSIPRDTCKGPLVIL